MRVNAQRAAQLVGRNERRVRAWIASGRLPAEKVRGEWVIETSDLQRMLGERDSGNSDALGGRAPSINASGLDTLQALVVRLEAVERNIARVADQLARLTATPPPITGLEWQMLNDGHAHRPGVLQAAAAFPGRSEGVTHPAKRQPWRAKRYATFLPDLQYTPLILDSLRLLPEGSVPHRRFCIAHQVIEGTIEYQFDTGKIPVTRVHAGDRGGRLRNFYTPDQVRTIVRIWREAGFRFSECDDPWCPCHPERASVPTQVTAIAVADGD